MQLAGKEDDAVVERMKENVQFSGVQRSERNGKLTLQWTQSVEKARVCERTPLERWQVKKTDGETAFNFIDVDLVLSKGR